MSYVIDAEFDGLTPTKIHCLSVVSISGENVFSTTDYDVMRGFLLKQDVLIGHNITRFDIPWFEKLLGIKVTAKLYDTLALSWYLYPERGRHGLESWGIHYGILKPKIDNWYDLSIEEYVNRCEEDVRINLSLWKDQWTYLLKLYGTRSKAERFLEYLSLKMYCAMLQEKSGWKVDLPFAQNSLDEMKAERERKVSELQAAMPSVPVIVPRPKPKRFLNKDGNPTKLGLDWLAFLENRGLPSDHEKPVPVTVRYEDANPASSSQIKDWLYSLGWKPQTFKYVKKTDGTMNKIPQLNLEHGKGICDSVKELYQKEPSLELLEGLSVLNHRIPLLEGIVKSTHNGRTKAQVQGLTNTLRFKHATVVNLPKVGKLFADGIRGSLIADEGKILCGSDMASLEDRIKQHYIYPLDPKYVNSMLEEDFDPHLTIAELAGMLTKEEVLEYKKGDKSKKSVRDIAKNGNYALIGALKIL